MPRQPSCLCGSCPKCDKRTYDLEYRATSVDRRRAYQAQYRIENHAALTQQKRTLAAERRVFIASHKADGCSLCDFSIAEACQFHHVDPSAKSFEVATMSGSSEAAILREIAKCVVLCPNCHVLVHRGLIDLKAAFG